MPLPSNPDPIHIVKLGGSLLDLPDAVNRFQSWRTSEMGTRGLLLVGGGTTADIVRDADARFNLGESRSHWLAIRAMQFNAHLIQAILPLSRLVVSPDAAKQAWNDGYLAVVEPFEWLRFQESQHANLAIPHRWSFTSDSIAAHIATHWSPPDTIKLTLLKSTLPSQIEPIAPANEHPMDRAMRLQVVDSDFAVAAASLDFVQLINLRSDLPITQPPPRDVLRSTN